MEPFCRRAAYDGDVHERHVPADDAARRRDNTACASGPPADNAVRAPDIGESAQGSPGPALCVVQRRAEEDRRRDVDRTYGHDVIKSGLPKTEGRRSSRNRSSCALAPMVRPPSLLSGTIASTDACQVTATYD